MYLQQHTEQQTATGAMNDNAQCHHFTQANLLATCKNPVRITSTLHMLACIRQTIKKQQ
jgi:hypothetical protein